MKLLLVILGLLFLSSCTSLSDYELGCRDGLEITQMKDTVKEAYCEALQKNRPKKERERR